MTEQLKRIEPQRNRGGEWVAFGDEEYRVPPLGFGALRDLAPEIEGLKTIVGSVPSAEQMVTVEKIIHRAMQRNYPDLALEAISDMLDVGNYERVLSAALSVSGLSRPRGASPGEVTASTGTTPTSP
jgi:hypothetical protein